MRKICAAERASLKSAERDAAIARNFLGCFSAGSYFVYLSRGTEADTESVIRALLREGKRVCVPRLEGERMFAAPYAAELERLLENLKKDHGYNELDAFLVLKDILARVWKARKGS